jgi:hypothetical protein
MYNGSEKHKNNLEFARKKALVKYPCLFCNKDFTKSNKIKHEKSCWLNPANVKKCVVCDSPIKNYKVNTTCGYSCSNKLYRSGPNNGSWKDDYYRTTCFYYHKKECVVCKESNIVEVHHLDENQKNNDPSNLIPLCPTHHQYWHSKYKHLVQHIVEEYITNWINGQPK